MTKLYFSRTVNIDNSMWGLDIALRAYGVCNRDTYVEHGVFLGDAILDRQRDNDIGRIISMSPFRQQVIDARIGKRLDIVGAYINHVEDKNELGKIAKENLGPVVVVFGGHSTNSKDHKADYRYVIESIVSCIPSANVYISLFYLDYLNEDKRASIFDLGATPVCFGSRYDPQFLVRLRRLVSLASYVVTTSIGTHIGYCLALKKIPFFIDTVSETLILDGKRYKRERKIYEDESQALLQEQEIKRLLPSVDNVLQFRGLNKEALAVLNEYYGFENEKTL